MRLFKLFTAALCLASAAHAVEPVGKDGLTFRFTEDEAQTCKEHGGCTIATNEALAEDAATMLLLRRVIEDLQKQLRAERSKRCI